MRWWLLSLDDESVGVHCTILSTFVYLWKFPLWTIRKGKKQQRAKASLHIAGAKDNWDSSIPRVPAWGHWPLSLSLEPHSVDWTTSGAAPPPPPTPATVAKAWADSQLWDLLPQPGFGPEAFAAVDSCGWARMAGRSSQIPNTQQTSSPPTAPHSSSSLSSPELFPLNPDINI